MRKFRATVYHQQRDRKHAWRAVLVTPLETEGPNQGKPATKHPMHEHTGQAVLPTPIEPPVRISPPPPPVMSHASKMVRKFSAIGSAAPSPTLPAPIGSGSNINSHNHNHSGHSGGAPAPAGSQQRSSSISTDYPFDSIFGLCSVPPGLPPRGQNGGLTLSINSLTPPPSSESPPTLRPTKLAPIDTSSGGLLQSGSGPFSGSEMTYFNSIFSLGQQDFLPWCPGNADSSTPGPASVSGSGGSLLGLANGSANGNSSSAAFDFSSTNNISTLLKSAKIDVETKDAETQTDQLSEQQLIKEMMANKLFRNEADGSAIQVIVCSSAYPIAHAHLPIQNSKSHPQPQTNDV
ncbi:hypothetical protein WR25_15228 [Diploscapter pachys]|uniref:Uncharacterized protein n=1 Tax=Diploscapter pachys TaxID=2018661 RepID=A0A2A2LUK7_9BILA|nr:hypothetical protein WR25_15228 [Diploscapter pachys]